MDCTIDGTESNAESVATFFFADCVAFDVNLLLDICKTVQIIYFRLMLSFAGY